MNRLFLVMLVSALLVTLGFAQTPDAGSTTDPANVKGCLGGSDGNYTVVEDGTRQTFKITTSSVDLKPHLGHDVKLVGHKASATASSGAADNSFAVTELSMISEHCGAAAAAAAAATVIPPAETVIAPDPAPAAPATTAGAPEAAPAAPASAPPVEAAAPAATVAPSAAVVSTPAVEPAVPAVAAAVAPPPAPLVTPPVEAAAPAAPVEPSPSTPSPAVEAAAPVANDTHPARLSAHARKLKAAKAAAATESAHPVTPAPEPAAAPAAEAATPAATATPVSPSAETVTAPAAATDATAPAPPATHRTGSLALLITFVVLVVVLGTTAPLIGRWRKRKALERDGSPNLSFTNETETELTTDEAGRDKAGPRKVA